MSFESKRSWLVAAWPGMGGVAQIAASHLGRALEAEGLLELAPEEFFDQRSILVRDGIVHPAPMPRSVLFGWKAPEGRADLVVLLGERQPETQRGTYCERLLEAASRFGAERVFTFAALGTPIDPRAQPRVFAAATGPELLAELREHGAVKLEEGEISGLNGVFLSAAAKRGLEGACLLGEFPFFASEVPHPKASAAVLRVFGSLAGLELDLSELDANAKAIEDSLSTHLEALQSAARAALPQTTSTETEPGDAEEESRPALSLDDEARIEALFDKAADDRGQALGLKAELDRLDVFERYEDRFLDLFRQAE